MFHFVEGSGADIPPNNWQSVFGGRAWSRANPGSATDKDWYLHLFSAGQPDWNWRNPAVGDYFDGVLRFWFDKGVDGLRIDVAHALFKADGLPRLALHGRGGGRAAVQPAGLGPGGRPRGLPPLAHPRREVRAAPPAGS